MNVLVYLVPMALILGLTALGAFFWSIRTRQYEDMEGAALRVLTDDDIEPPSQVLPLRGEAERSEGREPRSLTTQA
jgi:cbb3-type cytochrome oxidase maturation protein